MKLLLRILVFVFLVLPFTVAQTYDAITAYNAGQPVGVVDILIAGLLCLLSLGYLWSFGETVLWAWRNRQDDDDTEQGAEG